jgi:two-component system, OmpR family, sensor histidine kinase ChvG
MTIWPFSNLKLRSKLLLVSLVLVLLPWFGIRYIQAVENLLQQQQSQAVATIAKATGAIVEQYPDSFRQRERLIENSNTFLKNQVAVIAASIQIDGYNEEWLNYQSLMLTLPADNQLKPGQQLIDPQDLSVRYILAQHKKQLTLFLDVVDDSIVYRDATRFQRHGGDALVLALVDKKQRSHRYILSASAPGKMNAYEYIGPYRDPVIIKPEPLIKAAWQMSAYGYRVEISLPPSMVTDKLALAIIDADKKEQELQVSGLGDVRDSLSFSQLFLPSTQLSDLLTKMAEDGVRLWLLDTQYFKIASAGQGDVLVAEPEVKTISDLLYQLFLTQPVSDDESVSHETSVLTGQVVKAALSGQATTQRRQAAEGGAVTLVAAHPVIIDGLIAGAVVAEKNTNTILVLQNQAVKGLLNTTLILFSIVVIVLFGFASRLSFRIKRLNRDIALAVNQEGRVLGDFLENNEADELGELRQNFGQLFKRLGLYNHYLEALASRLAHELRTPIAVIKTSLEHVEECITQDGRIYLERAKTGSERINDIVARMSEASRLEQTVQNTKLITFDIRALIIELSAVYQDIYPDSKFVIETPTESIMINGSAELIVQMLDKLINNAVDFHNEDSDILIKLERGTTDCQLKVKNWGQALPVAFESQIFQPMVSNRKSMADKSQPHLGLGLYIVKLISDKHDGKVWAENWQQGVEFSVELPIVKV